MPNRKKMLALVIHIPIETRERIGQIRKKLKLSCASDAIITLVDDYFESHPAQETQEDD